MENNKLLAEYLGKKVKEFMWKDLTILVPEDCDPITNWGVDFEIWQPDKDWNQLMMVVDKIEKDGFTWRMEHRKKYANNKDISSFAIWEDEDENPIVNKHEWQRIEAVYNACVEYLTLKTNHNENKIR